RCRRVRARVSAGGLACRWRSWAWAPRSPWRGGRLLRGVSVEAFPGLPTQLSGHDHALEQRWRRVARFAVLVEHDLGDVHRRVEAHEVEEHERAHRIAA